MATRELKFRVWDKMKETFVGDKHSIIHLKNRTAIIHKNLIITQFAGLEDMKENEIYEGDILIEFFGDDDWVIFKIIWNDIYDAGYENIVEGNKHCIYDIRLNRSYSRHTIIGNIYENPEMTKGKYWTKRKIKQLRDALEVADE